MSGSSGTLQGRLGGALKGKFEGKTGTLDEVVSLSADEADLALRFNLGRALLAEIGVILLLKRWRSA